MARCLALNQYFLPCGRPPLKGRWHCCKKHRTQWWRYLAVAVFSLLISWLSGLLPAPWTPDKCPFTKRDREVLRDLTEWDGASVDERRSAAIAVGDALEDFRYIRLEPFSCGGQEHEVGIFYHLRLTPETEFALLPGGTFTMGKKGEQPTKASRYAPHQVTLTEPFLIARTEVTQSDWEHIAGTRDKKDWKNKGPRKPAVRVTWGECQELYCKDLGLSLPSEAQWEYACRAGTTDNYCFGDEDEKLEDYAWYVDNSPDGYSDVKKKSPNAFGLYDMHGNVWEWCLDEYSDYSPEPGTNPVRRGLGRELIVRGGRWNGKAEYTRSYYRDWKKESARGQELGFRPVKTIELDEQ